MSTNYRKIAPKNLDGNVFDLIGNKWMLITAEKDNKANTMTASWGGMGIMWAKPVAFCVIRPVRYTYEFIESGDCYTLSFLPDEYKPALNILGTKSGRDCDKIKQTKLTPIEIKYGDGYKSTAFAESNIILACKKLYCHDVSPDNFIDSNLDEMYPKKDYHRMYFGEIVECLIKE